MYYVVYAEVDAEAEVEWVAWMREHHVAEVVRTGYFDNALMLRVEGSVGSRPAYRMIYSAADAAAIDAYLAGPAARLRAEHQARFDGRVEARREQLSVVARITR